MNMLLKHKCSGCGQPLDHRECLPLDQFSGTGSKFIRVKDYGMPTLMVHHKCGSSQMIHTKKDFERIYAKLAAVSK